MAFYLGKKAEEYATHRWTLYVRGPRDEDLSTFVDQVVFTLHPSFVQPVRVIKKPPFEISETGWGEFEAGIRIVFRDPEEQPVDLFHQIRLYPPASQHQVSTKKPVVAESYDEVVFADPRPPFHAQLLQYGGERAASSLALNPDRKPTAFPEHYTAFDEAVDLELLGGVHAHLLKEIALAKQRLVNMEAEAIEEKKAHDSNNNNNSLPAPASSNNNNVSANNNVTSSNNNGAAGLVNPMESSHSMMSMHSHVIDIL